MLSVKPKSNWVEENGLIHWERIGTIPENPELINWENEYKAECDRLAAQVAVKYRLRWGRWFVDSNCLVTSRSLASYPGVTGRRGQDYDFELCRCNTANSRANWIEHMEEKPWIGEQGLKDLAQAFEELIKLGLIKL